MDKLKRRNLMAWKAAYHDTEPRILKDQFECAQASQGDWKIAALRHVPYRRWLDMFACPSTSLGSRRLAPVSTDITKEECIAALETYLLVVKKVDFDRMATAAAMEIGNVLLYPIQMTPGNETEHREMVRVANRRKVHLLRMALSAESYHYLLDKEIQWAQGYCPEGLQLFLNMKC